MRRVRHVVGLVLGMGAVGMLAPAMGQALTYSVKFEIQKGKYLSNYSCLPSCEEYGGIHAFHETDENVLITTSYEGLKIPSKGRPEMPIAIRGDQDSGSVGNWNLFGSVWTSKNPDTSYNCHGLLFITDTKRPDIFSAPNQTSKELKLDVQSGDVFQPKSVAGTNCDDMGAEHWHAFYPATFESPGDGFLPDMLTARVSLPLAALRRLHKGDVWGMTFHEGMAKRRPPSSCSDFTGVGSTCTQSLHWTGHLKVTRTG